jgi:7-cyano-7-deazaguanine synthase
MNEKKAIAMPSNMRENGDRPCGVCDSCRIRDEALIKAGYPELTSENF